MAERLIRDIDRIIPANISRFHDAVMEAGAPVGNQSIRYLPFNRQVYHHGDTTTTLSLVVLLNNARIQKYLLTGIPRRLSRWVFKLSRNTMDRFIHAVRLD